MSNSPFRDNIPTYRPPDRVQWEADHGKKPYELKGVMPHKIEHARRRIERDFSEIEREGAIETATLLDEICEGVLYRAGLDDRSNIVHFDPETQSFWAYPL